jgi:hypothetical protein
MGEIVIKQQEESTKKKAEKNLLLIKNWSQQDFEYKIASIINFINKCCLPILFVIVFQTVLWYLANYINKITTDNGYWQIFVVIPVIDLNIPRLENIHPFLDWLLHFSYLQLFCAVYFILPLCFYFINKRVFYRYIIFAILSYFIQFLIAVIFPCYDYLEYKNWQPYDTKRLTNYGWWLEFPSYHISIIFIITIFSYIIYREKKNKLCLSLFIFSIIYTIIVHWTTLFNKQHFFLDGVAAVALNLFCIFIDTKFKICAGIYDWGIQMYNKKPIICLVIFYILFLIVLGILILFFNLFPKLNSKIDLRPELNSYLNK